MDAQAKLKAKTGLTEMKVILGWLLNFQQMTIAPQGHRQIILFIHNFLSNYASSYKNLKKARVE
jgi:hypothetical protein